MELLLNLILSRERESKIAQPSEFFLTSKQQNFSPCYHPEFKQHLFLPILEKFSVRTNKSDVIMTFPHDVITSKCNFLKHLSK